MHLLGSLILTLQLAWLHNPAPPPFHTRYDPVGDKVVKKPRLSPTRSGFLLTIMKQMPWRHMLPG